MVSRRSMYFGFQDDSQWELGGGCALEDSSQGASQRAGSTVLGNALGFSDAVVYAIIRVSYDQRTKFELPGRLTRTRASSAGSTAVGRVRRDGEAANLVAGLEKRVTVLAGCVRPRSRHVSNLPKTRSRQVCHAQTLQIEPMHVLKALATSVQTVPAHEEGSSTHC